MNSNGWDIVRNRSSVVLIENNKIGLIKRIREDSVYYVFPGGGIEEGETPEIAARREALEELGVEVKINKCIAKVEYHGIQYYFLSEIIAGTFGTGQGEEFKDESRERGKYVPIWVNIERLSSIDVRPKEVAMKVLSLSLLSKDAVLVEKY